MAIGDPCVAENCALKECRAEAGELFGLCQFKLNEDYSEKTLVDLTIAEDVLYEDLNRQVDFKGVKKKFQFPGAFEQGFLSITKE